MSYVLIFSKKQEQRCFKSYVTFITGWALGLSSGEVSVRSSLLMFYCGSNFISEVSTQFAACLQSVVHLIFSALIKALWTTGISIDA